MVKGDRVIDAGGIDGSIDSARFNTRSRYRLVYMDRSGGKEDPNNLDHLKKDLFSYIETNISKIEANLPVFYGYIVSSLEKLGDDLSDAAFDEVIDDITFRLLEESERVGDPSFVERVSSHALRSKRKSTARIGIDLAAGIKLMKMGDYYHAITYLKQYSSLDALIASSVAYCYYSLSLREIAEDRLKPLPARPSEMELLAREQMLLLAQKRPPFHVLARFTLKDEPWLARAFWLMITTSMEWFPSEPGFLHLGIEKARQDGNREMRKELCKVANERFFQEMFFLRETYHLYLEERDPIGAAGIVKQMIQQYPEDLEPIYYGIKLSLLTATRQTYDTFRKLAIAKNMPQHCLLLLDLGFSVILRDRPTAEACLQQGKKQQASLQYYFLLLEYLVQDAFSEDSKRVKRAKKTILDTIELYCLPILRTPAPKPVER